jgi:RhoGAP domain
LGQEFFFFFFKIERKKKTRWKRIRMEHEEIKLSRRLESLKEREKRILKLMKRCDELKRKHALALPKKDSVSFNASSDSSSSSSSSEKQKVLTNRGGVRMALDDRATRAEDAQVAFSAENSVILRVELRNFTGSSHKTLAMCVDWTVAQMKEFMAGRLGVDSGDALQLSERLPGQKSRMRVMSDDEKPLLDVALTTPRGTDVVKYGGTSSGASSSPPSSSSELAHNTLLLAQNRFIVERRRASRSSSAHSSSAAALSSAQSKGGDNDDGDDAFPLLELSVLSLLGEAMRGDGCLAKRGVFKIGGGTKRGAAALCRKLVSRGADELQSSGASGLKLAGVFRHYVCNQSAPLVPEQSASSFADAMSESKTKRSDREATLARCVESLPRRSSMQLNCILGVLRECHDNASQNGGMNAVKLAPLFADAIARLESSRDALLVVQALIVAYDPAQQSRR